MTGTHKPSTIALLSDHRVKVLLVIAMIAIVWAIVAHTMAGSRKESMEALEAQLAATQREHQQIQAQMSFNTYRLFNISGDRLR